MTRLVLGKPAGVKSDDNPAGDKSDDNPTGDKSDHHKPADHHKPTDHHKPPDSDNWLTVITRQTVITG